MVGPQGLFGPIPASTSAWVTTSERERDRSLAEGEPMLEVWLAAPVAEAHPDAADAARYRWLRNLAVFTEQDEWFCLQPKYKDAFVDAALQAGAPKGGE